ncbi:hypothetical protein [Candidatus Venteria ishoeyi]|uniref:hypothetical protein n=1 Tax=Candidatus Venteria ishoeyi TaxID=1899563 RepID=UPI00255CD79A|nr:hypothetical protein [Candidatus Venteria ishoeyi]
MHNSTEAKVTSQIFDYTPEKQQTVTLQLSKQKITTIIGEEIPEEKIIQLFENMDFKIHSQKDIFEIVVP